MIHATSLAVRDVKIIQINHIFSFEQKPMGYASSFDVVKTNFNADLNLADVLCIIIVLKHKVYLG